MDLSALIFVVLAVAWAGYLLPRALRRHEELAASRPLDSFSDTMRVLERTPATMKALRTPPPASVTARVEVERALTRADKKAKHDALRTEARPVPASTTYAATVRRRRVLLVLLAVTALVAGAAGLGHVPWLSVVVPVVLVLGWLVLCRLMVRQTPARAAAPAPAPVATSATAPVADPAATPTAEPSYPVAHSVTASDLETDGSLWDPLPLTLPTYVSKPAARRTVRTIDLTQVTSSGHDAGDSRLAREAAAAAAAKKAEDTEPVRKVAGA
ncbi:hypothetical protein D9V37_14835 [Nocardioides mangrovicus]|uniref:Large exoprotein n=1 Tax=Nocardioides mangrovicus TaxID=2478913 RepID=A0A3L8NXA4_9ACTN|nr:hypothetical protein [Nocardioides mangrovicus]RLV47471.1 hypothetical protein D9V37_14835 [Nocardioides mangrovicus]